MKAAHVAVNLSRVETHLAEAEARDASDRVRHGPWSGGARHEPPPPLASNAQLPILSVTTSELGSAVVLCDDAAMRLPSGETATLKNGKPWVG